MKYAPIKPAWTLCDMTLDLTDNWMEATDPENEWGEECTGYFDKEPTAAWDGTGDCWMTGYTLKGLRIDDGGTPAWIDREGALKILGFRTVHRIEDMMMEDAA